MIYSTLYKRDLSGGIREWILEVEGNRYRTISGLIDGAKVTSEWSEVFGKNTGRANATTDREQALKVAETLTRIRKEQGCYERVADIDKGKAHFQPMLASKWDAVKDKINISDSCNIFVQRKLDGCRCIVDRYGMHSRNGKEWISAPHIYKKLKPIFEIYPDLILDGELYYHSSEDNFNEVISLIRKTKPTREDLEKSAELVQYWIYDVPSCHRDFKDRNTSLNNLFEEYPKCFDSSFVNVETFKITDKSEVQDYLEQFVSEGYEGAIVRLDAPYECKRSKNLLKVKQFQDEEFTVVDIEEGRGNLAGKAGRIIVNVNGVRVAAGLKFNHEEAQEIWEHKNYYVGKSCTVRYFSKTNDGSLRFPKAVQIAREEYE